MMPCRHRAPSLRAALAAAALALAASPAAAAPDLRADANDRAFDRAARSVERGGRLAVEGLLLAGESATSALELQRFEVWRANAVVEIDGRRAAAPRTAYFKGSVVGEAGSSAFLSVRESGDVNGVVMKGGGIWLVGRGRELGALRSRRADLDAGQPPFECGVDALQPASRRLGVEVASSGAQAGTILDQARLATLAIETDYEYYAKFGNTTAALEYMGDLIGYADLVYSREISTDMAIGYSRLWTGGAASDPWTIGACGSEPCGTDDALYQFRDYWNANMKSVARTAAHLLSGKGLGGGIAWVGVLCGNYGSPGSSYDYGLSASLGASFNWDGDQTHNPAAVVWDIMVVQHEIGHNFNSPHSHDYCNIGGSAQPIDQCYASTTCGTPQLGLPSCSGPTPFFHNAAGTGAGTIMSYCHQVSGGYNNIAMTFGEGHTCGTMPGREADRMSAFVTARASSYASCFAPLTCGNGVLDAGEQCDSTNLAGASCSSRGFFGGTLRCTSQCTFDTSLCTNCGNNALDGGETCDGTALGGASCGSLGCAGGALLCNATCSGFDKALCTGCPPCNGNGLCDLANGQQESCATCPGDCAQGTASGATCGNKICEIGNGEDCLSCPGDCNGVQTGKTSARYCCGDGAGTHPLSCNDSKCTANGRQCTTTFKPPTSYCCGDAACSNGESCATCNVDCDLGIEVSCTDGRDNDCDGLVDCADSACVGDAACACKPAGQSCTAGSQCCSGSCNRKRGTCN